MTEWQRFIRQGIGPDGKGMSLGAWTGAACYGDLVVEYTAVRDGVGLHDRSYRGLLEITGADRADWLHNLTTNHVKTLQPGDGNYAFACNAKGRILFDMNVLVRADAIWVDLDHRWIDSARQHFDKYTIIEDVAVRDRSAEFIRLAATGEKMAEVLSGLHALNVGAMAQLQTGRISIEGVETSFFRHDFCGPAGVEFFVPANQASKVWQALAKLDDVFPAGYGAVDLLRIEAGLPWPLTEITDDVLPAETGQLDRAVSFNKGCYIGQEIVERMRVHQSLARILVRLEADGDAVPPPNTELRDADRVAGRITSACRAAGRDTILALGYVRPEHNRPGTELHMSWGGHQATFIVRPIADRH